ncbi:hypothetical protein Tco_0266887 [Tanacetum coccineum]
MSIPSESEDFSDIESECDVPDYDDSQMTNFSTFSNPLFDDSTSSDDESSHEEFNPIHNKDLDSTPKNDRFNTESYLLESLLNRDTLMASSPKIDSIFDEFAGELITIPPRIMNREHEEYISLMERLLYDNSSPRPPPDYSIPPGIESDDYDSEGDDNSTSLPEFESFHVDYPDSGDSTCVGGRKSLLMCHYILAHQSQPSYGLTSFLLYNDLGSVLDFLLLPEIEPDLRSGICMKSNPRVISCTLSPVIDTLLPFSSKNEDKVFNHGVLASKEKSPPSSSHRGFKASKLFHHKSLMLIHGENIPILDVPIAPDYEDSRACGFVLRSLELQSSASF